MTRAENLLVVAMEECAELQQAISKAMRFGMDHTHPDNPDFTNARAIQTEFVQLEQTMRLLERRRVLPEISLAETYIIRGEKLASIEKYEAVSKELGHIKDQEEPETFAAEIAAEIKSLRVDAKKAWESGEADCCEARIDALEWVLGRLTGEDTPRSWAHY